MNTFPLSLLKNFHWNVYYRIEPKHQGTAIKEHMSERRVYFIPLLELVCHNVFYSTISAFYIYGITIWMIAYWGFENKQMELREWNIWILNPLWTNTELKQAFVDEKEWQFITRYNKYFYFVMGQFVQIVINNKRWDEDIWCPFNFYLFDHFGNIV